MMNLRYVFNIEGKILIVIGLFMLTSLPWVFYFNERELIMPIVVSVLIPIILGSILILITKRSYNELKTKDGYIIVSLAWVSMGIIGSLPFYLSDAIPSFIDAVFESVSGFTTTGSSILTDIESLPKSLLYWRNLTHWIGGMGIIVLVLAVLPRLGTAGYQLFTLELSNVTTEKIKPRTKDIAKRLWTIYFGLTFILILLLMAGDMNFFDSLCNSFGTIATGGFSPKNASIGHYSSYSQYVIMIFMLVSGINFTLHYFFLNGNFKRIFIDNELKTFLFLMLLVGTAVTVILHFNQQIPLEKSFRDAFFQVISILTATGFATTDFLEWKEIAWILIFLLMFVGACVGSTGGGIKVIRHVVAFKNIKRSFLKLLHPTAIIPIRINGKVISEDKVGSIMAFIMIYLLVVIISTLVMSSMGLDGETSIGSVLATLGGIGPGIGSVGPASNFAHIPDPGKIYLSVIMIVGRLEILTFLVLFTPHFWKV